MIFDPQAKLLWHGSRVGEWLNTGRSRPILIEIAPVGYCNAACPWCFCKKQRSNERINKFDMFKAVDDLLSLDVKAINWTGGGEPILHPDFGDFVDYASRKGLKQGLFTNGYENIPNQDKFEWIRISLTDKGLSSIKKPAVPFGICLNHVAEHNDLILTNLCLEARDFGASYFQVRPALVGSYKEQPLLAAPDFLKIYETNNFKVYITDYKYDEAAKPKEYLYCYGYHFCPSIDWNGNVSTCLYLSNRRNFVFGNLRKKSLLKIWGKIPEEIKVTEECQNCCKNHEINKILYKAKNVTLEDFI